MGTRFSGLDNIPSNPTFYTYQLCDLGQVSQCFLHSWVEGVTADGAVPSPVSGTKEPSPHAGGCYTSEKVKTVLPS